MTKTENILIRHPTKPARRFAVVAAITAFLVSAAEAQVVIDMPAPPRKEAAVIELEPPPASQPDEANEAIDPYPAEPDAGDLALRRYAYGRTGTYDTYQFGSQFMYQSNAWWWGGGFWPWWGSCSVKCCDKPASSVKCSVTGRPG